MQIVSIGDNLHEISHPVFWDKEEKNHQFVFRWISQESGKGGGGRVVRRCWVS